MQKAECNRICNILLMIVTPCLLLSNLQRPLSAGNCQRTLFSLGLAVVSSLFAILAARFLFLPRGQQENKRIERYAASFGNRGLYWDSVGNRHFRRPIRSVCRCVCGGVSRAFLDRWRRNAERIFSGNVLERSAVESGDTQRSGSGARCL